MPYGGTDWLALTQEATLEPDLPICDPHHHFYFRRLDRIPYHNYQIEDLYTDLNSGHNIVSTVFVEARAMYRPDGPEEMRPVGEVEFVQGMAAAGATGLYGPAHAAAAIVGHANLNLGERVEFIFLPTGTGVRFASLGDAISEGWVATVAGCDGGAQPIR